MNEIFLGPGDMYFGGGHTRIRTLLGSCVALTVWHPVRHFGGMCHVMLPSRSLGHWAVLDGRYADEAFAMMVERIRAKGTQPGEYQAKLFGGGNMFPMIKPAKPGQSVAQKNIEACRRLAATHGLQVYVEEVGGAASRSLVFDLRTGDVMVRKSALLSNRSELENHSR